MIHIQACLGAMKDGKVVFTTVVGLFFGQERSRKEFHDCGSAEKFVQTCLSIRKDRESSFHHCVCAG